MDAIKKYENFPAWIVILSMIFSLAVYGIGFAILLKAGLIFFLLYLVLILAFEYRLIRYHCVNCFYWGKTCGFGKGWLSSMFFKRGDISKFCVKEMSWKDMVPDLLVTLIPVVTGIILLIIKFEPIVLAGIALLIILITFGNGYIRGNLTCKYCKQRELGCPADKLFNKEGQGRN